MPEVSVNINGRDNGLGRQIDSLREKVKDLNQDASRLTNIDLQTPTQRTNNVKSVVEDVNSSRVNQTKKEFDELRRSLKSEFAQDTADFKDGKITGTDFNKSKKRYTESLNSTNSDEEGELKSIEADSNKVLKEILQGFRDRDKIEREKKQQNNEDAREVKQKGYLGGLYKEREDLRAGKLSAPSLEEAKGFNSKLTENQKKINAAEGLKESGGDKAVSTLSGGLPGMATSLLGAVGMSTIVAGAVVAAGVYLGNKGFELQKSANSLNALRVTGESGIAGRDKVIDNFTHRNGNLSLASEGINNGDFIAKALQTAQISGSGKDLSSRTFENSTFNKAYGVDITQNSQFDRMLESGNNTADNTREMMNVLASTGKSSLKSTDLSSLKEKIEIQTSILSNELSKRNKADDHGLNRIFAAFESQDGFTNLGAGRSANLLEKFQSGFEAKGTSDLDLIKFQSARAALPGLSDVDVRRVASGEGDMKDRLKYMNYLGKNIIDSTKGNDNDSKNARESMLKAFFPEVNGQGRDMFAHIFETGGIKDLKGIKNIFSKQGMLQNAKDNTTEKEVAEAGAENASGEAGAAGLKMAADAMNTLADFFSNWLKSGSPVKLTNAAVATPKNSVPGKKG